MVRQLIHVLGFVIFFVSIVQAQDLSEAAISEEQNEAVLIERARKRLFPGGRDEEDLQVQALLLKPRVKLTDEFSEEPPAEAEEEF